MRVACTNTNIIPEYAGIYETEGELQGIDVHIQPDGSAVLFIFTYDSKGTRYYIANIASGATTFAINTTHAGTFSEPSKREEVTIGIGALDLTPGKERLYYNTSEHGRGSWPLRLCVTEAGLKLQSNSALDGVYYPLAKEGSGIVVRYYPGDDIVSAYWFTYDQVGRQRWFVCAGHPNDITVYEVLGGKFGWIGGEVIECGHAWLEATSFHYALSATRLYANGSDRLIKAI